jgi:hypothetical protein
MTTAYLIYNTQGADLGVFRAESQADALRSLMSETGHGDLDFGVTEGRVFVANLVGDGEWDVLTWDNAADAEDDPGANATSRSLLAVVTVEAIEGSKADVLREIESRLGDEGTPEIAAALYAEGNHDTDTWYVRSWDKALEAAIAYA